MKLKQVTSYLESIAPLDLQEDYDNSGLIIGDPDLEVTSAIVCLDVIEEVIDEAIDNESNLIISHHPIIFSGIRRITGKNSIERTIIKAIKNNIAIYAIHTNLDVVKSGVNSRIADILELKNQKILRPRKRLLKKLEVYCPNNSVDSVRMSLFKAGAGAIGLYKNCSFLSKGQGTFLPLDGSSPSIGKIGEEERSLETKVEVTFPNYLQEDIILAMKNAHPYEEVAYQIYALDNIFQDVGLGMFGELSESVDTHEFLKSLKQKMKSVCIKHTDIVRTKIKRVAVCGGSGSMLIQDASLVNADIFITSDIKYHDFFIEDDTIIIADIGHYESEQFTKDLIYDLLVNNFPKFAVRLSEINTNPINYL